MINKGESLELRDRSMSTEAHLTHPAGRGLLDADYQRGSWMHH